VYPMESMDGSALGATCPEYVTVSSRFSRPYTWRFSCPLASTSPSLSDHSTHGLLSGKLWVSMNGTASLHEVSPGQFSLLLNAGTTSVDTAIESLGFQPDGYFWNRLACFLVETEAPSLAGQIEYDSESGAFCARGSNKARLAQLATLINDVASHESRLLAAVERAQAAGFDLND
jgi:hypothetical protein